MKILFISRERDLYLPGVDFYYTDIDDLKKRGNTALQEIQIFEPDLIIEREFNDGVSHFEDLYEHFPNIKKAFIAIDTHCGFNRHLKYASNFDYLFVAISSFVPLFKEKLKIPVYWLPLWFSGSNLPIKENREIEFGFVGRYSRANRFHTRATYIELLQSKFKDFKAVTDYQKMPSIINNTQLSFNCSLKEDMNFRVFETLAYGSELITDSVPDIYKIRELRDRITVYNDATELINLSNYMLEHKKTTLELKKDQDFIKQNHTLEHRIKSILDMINTGKQNEY